jgi:hypothetical protein
MIFRDEDWNRLKKIGAVMLIYAWHRLILVSSPAEGNPDEEKIGAFGVGECSPYLLVELINWPQDFTACSL